MSYGRLHDLNLAQMLAVLDEDVVGSQDAVRQTARKPLSQLLGLGSWLDDSDTVDALRLKLKSLRRSGRTALRLDRGRTYAESSRNGT